MFMMTIFIVLVLAFLLYRRGWRRTGHALTLVAALLYLSGASGLLATPMLHGLQWSFASEVPPRWAPNNLIVVLGGGAEPVDDGKVEPGVLAAGRIIRAASLYAECKAGGRHCTILISGGDPLRLGASEAAVYQQALLKLGVPVTDIRLDEQSLNTWQNGQFSAALIRQSFNDPATSLLLVTSAYHMQRSLMIFSHFGLNMAPVRADYLACKPFPAGSSYNLLMTDIALHEYLGIWRVELSERMGWNRPV